MSRSATGSKGRAVHWADETGVFCGAVVPSMYWRAYPQPEAAHLVTCIDCITIASLVTECEDETERAEMLSRERQRYVRRPRAFSG